jgi:HEPN domain-containing protein
MQHKSKPIFPPLVLEWFDRGVQELETANLLFESSGHTGMIAVHIHQAAEKYLKGYLVLKGIVPIKTHDLGHLLQNALAFDPALKAFEDYCDITTRYYLADRYPPGNAPRYSREEMGKSIANLKKLIAVLTSKS